MSAVSDERRGKEPETARPRDPAPPAEGEGASAGKPAPPAGKVKGAAGKAAAPAADGERDKGEPNEPASPKAQAGPAAGKAAGPAALTAAELQDRWLRAEADLRNFRRRAALEREEAGRTAEDGVLLEMIAVLDDLDRALESAREAGASESWTAGVRLTAERVRERLSRYGVVTLDPAGKPFDPRFHEALLEIDAPEGASPGAVVQVVHRGYARGDRALRAARVVVARAAGGPKQ